MHPSKLDHAGVLTNTYEKYETQGIKQFFFNCKLFFIFYLCGGEQTCMQQYPGAEARAGCRMSSSITLPLRTFTKGPPLFSSAGWPESSGDLSASNVGLQSHTTTLGFLHGCLGFKLRSLGLQGRSASPLTRTILHPPCLWCALICQSWSPPWPACGGHKIICRSQFLALTVWVLGVGLRLQDFTAVPLPTAPSPVQDHFLIAMYLS